MSFKFSGRQDNIQSSSCYPLIDNVQICDVLYMRQSVLLPVIYITVHTLLRIQAMTSL